MIKKPNTETTDHKLINIKIYEIIECQNTLIRIQLGISMLTLKNLPDKSIESDLQVLQNKLEITLVTHYLLSKYGMKN